MGTPVSLGCLLSLGIPEQQISIEDTIHEEEASDLSDEDAQVLTNLLTLPSPHPSTAGRRKRPMHFIYSDIQQNNSRSVRSSHGDLRDSGIGAASGDPHAQVVQPAKRSRSSHYCSPGVQRPGILLSPRNDLYKYKEPGFQDPFTGTLYLSSL